jgi:hypothetical protein
MVKLFTALLHFFALRAARGYRPERHYMRGPGPKCRVL